MPFSQHFFNNGSRAKGATTTHNYANTADSLATIKGAGYFTPVKDMIETNDFIAIVGSDGAQHIRVAKNATTGAITTTSAGGAFS